MLTNYVGYLRECPLCGASKGRHAFVKVAGEYQEAIHCTDCEMLVIPGGTYFPVTGYPG